MAKPKTHYWKKSDPRNPVPLERGGYLELEIVDQGTGIVLVADPKIQEELVARLGTYGLEQIDKVTYEDLKKNRSSTSLRPQEREEIGGIRASTAPDSPPRPIDVGAAAEGVEQKGVFAETEKALPLPADYKPKASKRPKPE